MLMTLAFNSQDNEPPLKNFKQNLVYKDEHSCFVENELEGGK